MKTKLLLTLCFIASLYSFAQTVNIPDTNFKAYLVGNANINTNGDTEIQVTEASAYTGGMNISNQSIQSLVGVEAFTEIITLQAFGNSLTSIDVSQNTKLVQLLLEDNFGLSGQLDLSALTQLTDFKGNTTQLVEINMANGNNANVTRFQCFGNPSLSCVNLDSGFTPGSQWTVDDAAVYSGTCFTNCTVTIPDANFKNYLVGNTAININNDTEIQCDEAANYSGSIMVSNLSIQDLTGIETFFNITELNCSNNQLSSLNLLSNTDLLILDCSNNQLTGLDVSLNNQLVDLFCSGNMIASLDVSNNIGLVKLDVSTNQLLVLDVNALPNLDQLVCSFNQLTSLNILLNSVLTKITCNNNDLYTLDVANGNNINFSAVDFDATSNPNLDCIRVDDVTYSNANWTNIDPQTSFDANCNCIVNIPDANFKAYLVGNSNININGDSEIQCSEAILYSGGISIAGLGIQDLTGIEAFTEIGALQAFSNLLTTVDLSQNTKLTQLLLENNVGLTGQLDLSAMTQLTDVKANSTQISQINMANGNNSNVTRFQSTPNSALNCVQIDSGFTPNNLWTVANSSVYDENCFTLSVGAFVFNSVSLYPNTTSTIINIEMASALKQATVYSVLGVEVLKTTSKTINTTNLKSGLYLIKIQSDLGVITKRFIRN
jgi:hypothetical protein